MPTSITDIAIIGMAGRFPGARDIHELWRNLCSGVETIRHFRLDELDDGLQDRAAAPDYVKARGIIDDADKFDAAFFGIYPKEAELIDPQQRIFLECCWHAFEDAGYDPQRCDGTVGIYAGCSPNTYFLRNICAQPGFVGEYTAGYQVSNVATMLGSNFEFLPTRVAYKLNLRGPAFSLNSGCSTSLVAACQACLSLQNYQCDMALAGGVSVTFPQKRGYLHESGGMVSPDGHCRTFDEAAQGTVFGDGAGVVLLKRLEDALADRDHVYGVIKGFGLTNDGGGRVGFAAPGVDGQVRAIAMAHAAAGIDPASITYVEAHGTGTPLGDPIEIEALTRAFRRHTTAKQFCAIGAVKTNVGHLDVAAGVTGLIKTVLSLHHKMLPPTLNFVRPNPALKLEDSPFYVNTALTAWERGAQPLRAGVSAFGMGGTNAHVVLEEAPALEPLERRGRAHLLVLSARSKAAVDAISTALGSHLASNPQVDLGDAAWTLISGRRCCDVRRMLVAKDCADAAAALTLNDPKRLVTSSSRPERPSVAFMFPGQGTQYAGMGRHLYSTDSYFQEQIETCLETLESVSDIDLRRLLIGNNPPDTVETIDDTLFAQPALFVLEYALARFWMHLGVTPSGLIGHSVGEFVAACLAGVFSLEDGLRLICERGRMMHGLPRGSMLAVRLSEDQLAGFLCPGLDVAAINSPSLAVVAGPDDAVSDLERRLDVAGAVHRRLRTSHAFHSGMMEPVVGPFRELAGRVTLKPPGIPFLSSVTGDWISAEEATSPEYWARHLRSPVKFSDGIKKLRATDWALLEVGPGNTLSTLARQHQSEYPEQLIVSSLPDKSLGQTHEQTILNALGQLWTHGINPEWSNLYGAEKKRRVALPVYPFERKRSWFEAPKAEPEPPLVVELNESLSRQRGEEPAGGEVSTTSEVMGIVPATQSQPVPDGQPAEGHVATGNSMESARPDGKGQIRSALEAIFADLSGMDMSSVPSTATFLEMGFDSLFLTQVSQTLQTRFGLKIKFRQLVDQLSDLSSLTDYLQEHIPLAVLQSAPPAPASQPSAANSPPAAQLPAHSSAAMMTAGGQVPSASGKMIGAVDIEDLCKLQLQTLSDVMAKQLEMLRDAGSATGRPAAAKAVNAEPAQGQAPISAAPAESKESELQASPRFKPLIQTGSSADLTAEQQRHLDALIERYNRRTGGSKRMTQQHRARLADPRVAAGLRPQWKELVYPIVTVHSKGSRVWDVDGNEYIDLVNGYGPIMLGHSPDFLTAAVKEQLKVGFETGPQSPLAGKVAELICEMTGNERAAFCNTGSEAVMAAFRLARTVTGRNKIVLFSGAYHGMFDEVLVKGVKGASGPRSLPVAPGIPREKVENIIVLDYGTAESLRYIETHAAELAAVIVEPVQSRHPGLQPIEFLKQLRTVTESSGTAFIFDEVVTGFRVHPGGAQALFGIKADLATYGKVLGGGLPIGLVAGKAAFMDALDGGMWNYGDDSYPETGVTFFAGTFVRHPLALAAAWAVLNYLKDAGPELQEQLNNRTSAMVTQFNHILKQRQLPAEVEHFGSISYFGFPAEYRLASLFQYYMRERGVYIQEGFPLFLTTAHSDDDISHVVRVFGESLTEMQAASFLPATPVIDPAHSADAPPAPAYANGRDRQPLPEWQLQPQTTRTVDARGPAAGARVPLTESQLEIWLSANLGDEASCAYNESFTLKLYGNLNRPALLDAINRVIARHEALRITIGPEGDFQEFAPELKLEVSIEDLSALDDAARSTVLAELIADDARLPFNLTRGPLVRAKLIRLAPEEHHLVFTTHHIVCDGWSTNVILDELSKLYNALSAGNVCTLPTPMGFGAYASLQEEHFSSHEGAANESYWVEQFKQIPPLLDLPLDRPRPPIKSYDGATCRRVIPAQAYRNIKQTAAKQKCTLFVALLAGFQALLSRLSGQSDIVVGIPAAGQSLLEDETLVGHCVNFLPLRGHLENAPTAAAYLDQIKRTLLDAYDHQNYTYGRLVRRLSIQRDPGRLPLVEVQFNLERVGTGVEFDGLQIEVDPNAKAFVNHDLFLNVIESEQGLLLDCDYNTILFDAETIARWLEHYETLLEGMAVDVNQPVSRLPLISEAEIRRSTVKWNDTQSEYPRELCVHQLFEEQVRRTPEAIAAVYEGRQLSYTELNNKANQLAAYLLELGVGPGSLVGVFVERSLDVIVALLGVLKAGGAYVPMDPTYPSARVAFVLEDAKVSVLLSQQRLAGQLETSGTRVVCLDTDWDRIAHNSGGVQPITAPGSEDLAYVIYTSGSTGKPKGVEIPHRAVVNLLCSMRKRPGIKPSDVLVAVTTLSFDIAALELFLPLCVGARVVIVSRATASDGSQLLPQLIASEATMLQATPVTFRLLIEAGWSWSPRLTVLCGGEALPRELANQLLERSQAVWNMYGPTETTIWSSADRVTAGEGPVTIGTPINNTQFYVIDTEGQLAPIGKVAELYVGGDGLARSYYRRPELTAEKFVRGLIPDQPAVRLYKTGDMVRRLPDGTLEFLGRLDNQIKLRGFRIELGEIEAALLRHPAIRQAVVSVHEEVPGNKRLVAYLITDGQALTVTAIREFLTGKLPDYMLPSAVVRLQAMPLTPNGKVDRGALPAPDAASVAPAKEFAPPRSSEEKTLAEIWAGVLRLERVGIWDDLFELGADSLHIFQIAARANKAGMRIAAAMFLKHRTIADLVAQIGDDRQLNTAPAMPVIARVSREKYRVDRSSLPENKDRSNGGA
jgi:amino acid adenylation domain-containing protein